MTKGSEAVELSPDEVLNAIREMFPREYQIAVLAIANQKLSERVQEMESGLSQRGDRHASRDQ